VVPTLSQMWHANSHADSHRSAVTRWRWQLLAHADRQHVQHACICITSGCHWHWSPVTMLRQGVHWSLLLLLLHQVPLCCTNRTERKSTAHTAAAAILAAPERTNESTLLLIRTRYAPTLCLLAPVSQRSLMLPPQSSAAAPAPAQQGLHTRSKQHTKPRQV
jgi:hypothetical protein